MAVTIVNEPTDLEPDLVIDLARRQVVLDGRAIDLTRIEFRLLYKLASDPQRVFPRGELLRDVWGMPAGLDTRTLDSHVSRLRIKLGAGLVHNVRGVGYALARV